MSNIITPMHLYGMIMWDYVERLDLHKVFICWGDYGPYCEFKFESL